MVAGLISITLISSTLWEASSILGFSIVTSFCGSGAMILILGGRSTFCEIVCSCCKVGLVTLIGCSVIFAGSFEVNIVCSVSLLIVGVIGDVVSRVYIGAPT